MTVSDQLMHQIITVTNVEVVHDRVVRLTFDDGCVGELDLAPTFERLGGKFFGSPSGSVGHSRPGRGGQ